MEANAALKTIVRRDTGESYRKMLLRMAKESGGIDSPTDEDLARMDRKRVGKTLSNKDWQSQVDPEAKIAKMKDGRTHLAYKPEHAVDLDTGAVVAGEVHEVDKGDTSTLQKTLKAAQESLRRVTSTPPWPDDPAELVADKGYFSRDVLKDLDGGPWRTRIAEPKRNGLNSWRGDHEARRAVYNNRIRISSMVGKNHGKTADGTGRKKLRAYAGPGWRYAPGLVPGTGEHPETVPAPCGRFQSRPADAGQDRPWHPQGLGQSASAWLACAHLAQSASLNGLFGRRHGGRRTMLRDHAHRRHLRRRIAGNSFLQRPVELLAHCVTHKLSFFERVSLVSIRGGIAFSLRDGLASRQHG